MHEKGAMASQGRGYSILGYWQRKRKLLLYRGCVGRTEKKMEATTIWGIGRDNGKENGSYYYIGDM